MKGNSSRTTNLDKVLSLIRELPDQQNILIIPRIFIRMTGSINAALLLSQILYWSDKSTNQRLRANLMFAKTVQEFADELGLGEKALNHARERLECLGLIRTKIGGFAGKRVIFWRPEQQAITLAIQSAAATNDRLEPSENTYDALLAEFFGADAPHPDVPNRPNGTITPAQRSNEEVLKSMEEPYCSGGCELPETAVSNTYTTPHITPDTTTRQNIQLEVEGNEDRDLISPQWNSKTFPDDWMQSMQSLNPEIPLEKFNRLAEEFHSAFAEHPELSKNEIQLLLSFAVLTGFTNFQRTDLRDGKTRTIVERWIEPVQEWAQRNVTAEEIRAAIRGAKKDGMHPKLQCPASYSPRVLGACQSAAPSTNLYDDEA
jgi:hypothetical protein